MQPAVVLFKKIPEKTPIRVLATLPPTGTKAAAHAGMAVHLLDCAGYRVHTTSAAGPAYAGQFLHFAPKRRFEPVLAQQLDDPTEVAILYPAGLGFERINQKRWLHRRIEEIRRLRLAAGLLFRKSRAVLVFQPRRLWHPEEAALLALAMLAKLRHPFTTLITRQSTGAARLIETLTGQPPAQADPAEAEETVFRLATASGQDLGIFLSLAWARRAVSRTPSEDPARAELMTLLDAIELFTHGAPAPFRNPLAGQTGVDLPDSIASTDRGVPISAYMLHLHRTHHLKGKFPLTRKSGRIAFVEWYLTRAPKLVDHSLPLPDAVMQAHMARTCKDHGLESVTSTIPSAGCDLTLPPYLLALHRSDSRNAARFPLDSAKGRIAFAFKVLIDHATFQLPADFAGSGLRDFFTAPIAGVAGNLSRFELFCAIAAHAPVSCRSMLDTPWRAEPIRDWVQNIANLGYPLIRKMSGDLPAKTPEVHITGRSQAQTGLGQNQAMNQRALDRVSPVWNVYLHHVNADMIPEQMLRYNSPDAFHIGFLLWELQTLPRTHLLANSLLDEIWAPSRFVQQIYQRAFDRPVTFIGKGFDLPKVGKTDLGRYGVAPDTTCFLVCFDQHSSVARKNPLAAVQAFQAAFPDDPDKALLVKTTPAPADHWGDPEGQMKRIRKLAASDPRISVIEETVPFTELLSLVRSVDCLVSAHRAEGFGYLLAYAQKLQTPVIATGFSGCTDFCTPQTALVVDYHLQPVRKGEAIVHVPGAVWAEIDRQSLSTAMQTLLNAPQDTAARVTAAKQLMDGFYSQDAHRERVRARLDELGLTDCSLNVPMSHDPETRTTDRPRRVPPSG